MQDYYGNVMSKAMDEINQYTDEMGELNSVLDHYSSVLALIGKENDYNAQRTILTAQASNLKNEMEVQ
jgi:hypothetical protein